MKYKKIIPLTILCCLLSAIWVPAKTVPLGNLRVSIQKNAVFQLKFDDISSALGEQAKFESIKITKLPPATSGDFLKNGQAISQNDIILTEELSQVTFIPYPDFLGEVVFSYLVYAGTRVSNEATFTIEYRNWSESLPLENLHVETEQNISKEIILLPKNQNEQIAFRINLPPRHGTLNPKDERNHSVIYTPHKDFIGEDSFSYQEIGNSDNTATVIINVTKQSEPLPVFIHEDLKHHWANYSAGNLADRGIMCGEMVGGKYFFYPDKKMTRWEFCNQLLAMANLNIDHAQLGYLARYEDAASLPDYIQKIAALATQMNILEGVSKDGKLYIAPYQELTRAQAITMLGKLLMADATSEDHLYFIDQGDIPTWARPHFINLVNYGIIQGFPDNTIRPYSSLSKAQTAELIYQSVKLTEKEPDKLRKLKQTHQYYY